MNTNQVPLKMRVWAAVRNNPGLVGTQIAAMFKDRNPATITSSLSQLESAEMIYSLGKGYKSDPKRFYTDLEHYDPAKAFVKPVHQEEKAPDAPQPKIAPIEPVQEDLVETIMNTISLQHAHALYQRLHGMFG